MFRQVWKTPVFFGVFLVFRWVFVFLGLIQINADYSKHLIHLDPTAFLSSHYFKKSHMLHLRSIPLKCAIFLFRCEAFGDVRRCFLGWFGCFATKIAFFQQHHFFKALFAVVNCCAAQLKLIQHCSVLPHFLKTPGSFLNFLIEIGLVDELRLCFKDDSFFQKNVVLYLNHMETWQ